jgi:hypothetical protein
VALRMTQADTCTALARRWLPITVETILVVGSFGVLLRRASPYLITYTSGPIRGRACRTNLHSCRRQHTPREFAGATIRSFPEGADQACPNDQALSSPRIVALDEPPPLPS